MEKKGLVREREEVNLKLLLSQSHITRSPENAKYDIKLRKNDSRAYLSFLSIQISFLPPLPRSAHGL